uniref:Transmembrane protein 209 n=1 Tax=Rhabditophanes sp. KR3021 TaxID=114890 RepID=A0AC35TK47_9BILA
MFQDIQMGNTSHFSSLNDSQLSQANLIDAKRLSQARNLREKLLPLFFWTVLAVGFWIEYNYHGYFSAPYLPELILDKSVALEYIRFIVCTISTIISAIIAVDILVVFIIPADKVKFLFGSLFFWTDLSDEEVTKEKKALKGGQGLLNVSSQSFPDQNSLHEEHLYDIGDDDGERESSFAQQRERRGSFGNRSASSTLNSSRFDASTSFNLLDGSIDQYASLVVPRHSLLNRPTESIHTMEQLEEFMHRNPKKKVREMDFTDKFTTGYTERNIGIQNNGDNGINSFAALSNNVGEASKILFKYKSEHARGFDHLVQSRGKSPSARGYKKTIKLKKAKGSVYNPNIYTLPDILEMYGISYGSLSRSEGKLRVWIKQTILKPLLTHIDECNAILVKDFPGIHLKVGVNSLDAFQQCLQTKREVFKDTPLPFVLPFLKICHDQVFLIKRLKELVCDQSLKSYFWKAIETTISSTEILKNLVSGGRNTNTEPKSVMNGSLPKMANDTEILLHVFLTYMDSVLTSNPFSGLKPDGGPFSAVYLLKSSEQATVLHQISSAFYLQVNESTMHLRLVINGGEEIMDVGQDRNNFFRVIVIFMHHCMLYNNGKIDRINLKDETLNWVHILN